MRRCRICGQNKPDGEFYPKSRRCKVCQSAETQARKKGTVLPQRFCVRCETVKIKEHFPISGKSLRSWCYSCESPEGTRWCPACRNNKPEYSFGSTGGLGYKCADCRQEYERARTLRRHYDLTPEEYDQMLSDQNGVCAICFEPGYPLNVDHDHSTGDIRGLLCVPCNQGIGHFRDSTAFLLNAVSYLGSPTK